MLRLPFLQQHAAFGPGQFKWVEVSPKAIAAYWRILERERTLVLQNLSDRPKR